MELQRKIILIVVLSIIIVIGGLSLYAFWLQQSAEKQPQTIKPQESGIGEVMVKNEKTGQESSLISPTMPPDIFSTAGIINEIKSDRLIVRGEGTNFADNVSRNLIVIFSDQTLTFNKSQTFRWTGQQGLKQLQTGTQILIGSVENIRGKVEFIASTVNVLED